MTSMITYNFQNTARCTVCCTEELNEKIDEFLTPIHIAHLHQSVKSMSSHHVTLMGEKGSFTVEKVERYTKALFDQTRCFQILQTELIFPNELNQYGIISFEKTLREAYRALETATLETGISHKFKSEAITPPSVLMSAPKINPFDGGILRGVLVPSPRLQAAISPSIQITKELI